MLSKSLQMRMLIALALVLLAYLNAAVNHSNARILASDGCGQILNLDLLRKLDFGANILLGSALIGTVMLIWGNKRFGKPTLQAVLAICAILAAYFAFITRKNAAFLGDCDIFTVNPDTAFFSERTTFHGLFGHHLASQQTYRGSLSECITPRPCPNARP
jgi:hypothetical protein